MKHGFFDQHVAGSLLEKCIFDRAEQEFAGFCAHYQAHGKTDEDDNRNDDDVGHDFAQIQFRKEHIGQGLNHVGDQAENPIEDEKQKSNRQDNCDAAELVITSSMKTNYDVMDLGTSTHDPRKFTRFADRTLEQNTFHMGVKELDAEGLGPTRKELFLKVLLKCR